MLLADGAILATGLFTGAALYVSLVEHPARLELPTEAAVAQWRPSYKRATVMQASLAVAATLLAIMVWFAGAGILWLVAALLIGDVVPLTLVVIAPTNRQLQDESLDPGSDAAARLLIRWGQLHAVRTVLSLAAFLVMLVARG